MQAREGRPRRRSASGSGSGTPDCRAGVCGCRGVARCSRQRRDPCPGEERDACRRGSCRVARASLRLDAVRPSSPQCVRRHAPASAGGRRGLDGLRSPSRGEQSGDDPGRSGRRPLRLEPDGSPDDSARFGRTHHQVARDRRPSCGCARHQPSGGRLLRRYAKEDERDHRRVGRDPVARVEPPASTVPAGPPVPFCTHVTAPARTAGRLSPSAVSRSPTATCRPASARIPRGAPARGTACLWP